ncbi:hypothetical protein C2G38_2093413 [Gigaspora rosea]|uniref:MD-2-related lipid-recognition domain-containing protein n=1 Tax=Gigaspora rosea TaxID=44941 RepID=A0A397V1A2_9GLOM|nr:hypothetical protein C2G38_2093413 [Gigaspora rosea]CAG8684088.1 14281_t:CDS:1 [Gigaspora rosea]
MRQNIIFIILLLVTPFVINVNSVPCYITPTPPTLDLRFILFDTSHLGSFMALMYISQKAENNIYNDTKLFAEVYSENNIENYQNRFVFNLCALANLTCPILNGTLFSAQTHFIISNDTKVAAVSVSTEHDKHFGCEVYIFHNINIPTLTTSIPISTPHP